MFLMLVIPAIAAAQSRDSAGIAEKSYYNYIDNNFDNPEAIKYFFRKLTEDRDKLKDTFREILNDPSMKSTLKELKELLDENKNQLQKKNRPDINKSRNDFALTGVFRE
jgi:hypothetical protein